MKVILFSLLALTAAPALIADSACNENAVVYNFDKRFTYPNPEYQLDDTKFNVRMSPQVFEQLVTTAFNTANTNIDPLLELLHRINDGKISHNPSQEYTRITHKDFYHRLLPYVPYHSRWASVGMSVTYWTYLVQLNGKQAYIDVTIWGQKSDSADERITLLIPGK